MIKILVLEYPMLSNTGYWRTYRPLDVMRRIFPGMFSLTYKRDRLQYSDIMEHDVVITRRPSYKEGAIHVEFLRKCRDLGRHVIYDEDDLILGCPDTHELHSIYSKKDMQQQYIDSLKCASVLWVSTPAFRETIAPNAEVIPNAILPEDLPDDPAPDMGLIGWQGKSIQVHDLILAGWDWYEENKSKAQQWVFFGWKPPLRHLDNTTLIPYIDDTDVFMASFRKNNINAMWKPLIDCSFNNHKSNINLLGATMAGGYTITNYAGRPGWEYASKEILPYSEACDLWAAAKADILENYNLINTAQMRAESICRLVPHLMPQMQEA